MLNDSNDLTETRRSLLEVDDRNELAWLIRDFGLVHDPDVADLVERAATGDGEHSRLLRTMIAHPDEPVFLSSLPSQPIDPPMPAAAYRFQPMSRREQMKANPFMLPKAVERPALSKGQPRLRSAVLTDEAARLYRCLAFAMHEYSVVMNGHMTVTWEQWGIRDHAEAVAVLTEFNARMAKWLKVDANGRRRKGTTATAWGKGEPYYYAFIHEHASNRGFHSHQVFRVSDGKAKAFAEYAVTVLRRLTCVTTVPVNAVVFTPNTIRDGFAPHLPRFKKNEVERCWIWFRYLAKNLSPHEFKQVGNQCALQRDIFRIRKVFVPPQPVACMDVFGCSENISIGAQEKAGFVSKFDSADWTELYTSSELDEYRLRLRQQQQANEVAAVLAQLKI